ncbi:MAG: leucine-rich repeat domain-containing protein, partial [Ruminococcus sp.]|nr:leucine-rich repeat domain-containing protein [Ruminococcus sp.]
MKKIFSLLIAMVFTMGMVGALPIVAEYDDEYYEDEYYEDEFCGTGQGEYPDYSDWYKSGDYVYSTFMGDGTAVILDYIGTDTKITIPSEIDGYEITEIYYLNYYSSDYGVYYGDNLFLTSVTIPDSITGFNGYSFSGCPLLTEINVSENNPNYTSIDGVVYSKDLTEIVAYPCGGGGNFTVPDTVTKIGGSAFNGCKSLTGITIPNSVTEIGAGAFRNCTSLTSINIPNSVTVINERVFSGCTSLANITIPNSITRIYGYAFSSCESLETLTIPGSVRYVYTGAFTYCTSLKSVIISDGVIELFNTTFEYCRALEYVVIPDSVEEIGVYSFSYCGDFVVYGSTQCAKDIARIYGGGTFVDTIKNPVLPTDPAKPTEPTDYEYEISDDGTVEITHYIGTKTDIVIPSELGGCVVTSIGAWAFIQSKITSVVFPESIKKISDTAFYGCRKLTSVDIPAGITEIGEEVFSGCYNLTAINVSEDNPNYTSIDGVLFSKDLTELVAYPGGKIDTEFTVLDTVTKIGAYAFVGDDFITSVTLPNSVTEIGDGAFYGCTSLTSVTIPDGVNEIKRMTFSDSTGLQYVVIPESVTTIGNDILRGCGDVTIYGVVGSYAQTYAEENGITFADIDGGIVDPNLLTPGEPNSGDFDGNGEISIVDVVAVAKIVHNQISDITE